MAVHEQAARLAIPRTREHRGPEQRVEVRDVLADEVVELVLAVGPPELVEVDAFAAAQIQKAGHVADRRVEPDVEELVALAGNAEAEVGRVARDVPVLEARLEPLVELARQHGVDVLGHPVTKLGFESPELQEQMLGLADRRRRAGDRRDGVLELERRIRRAAALAGVAVLIGRVADRAGSADVTVRQEHLPLLVVRLLDRFAADQPAGREPPVELGRELLVLRGVRVQIVVDADSIGREIARMLGGDALDENLRRDALPARPAAWSACHGCRWRRRTGSGGRVAAGTAPRCRSGCSRATWPKCRESFA